MAPIKSSFVIVFRIAGMRNLGGIFTKCPKSFELQNPSGSDGGEEIVALDFSRWKERILRSACRAESKGEYVTWFFRAITWSSSNFLNYYVHVIASILQTDDLFFKFCGDCSAGRSDEERSRDNESIFQSP